MLMESLYKNQTFFVIILKNKILVIGEFSLIVFYCNFLTCILIFDMPVEYPHHEQDFHFLSPRTFSDNDCGDVHIIAANN